MTIRKLFPLVLFMAAATACGAKSTPSSSSSTPQSSVSSVSSRSVVSSSSASSTPISSSSSSSSSSQQSSSVAVGNCNGAPVCVDFDASANLPSGWSANSARVALSTEQKFSGTRSLKVTANGGGYNSNFLTYNLSNATNLNKAFYGRMMVRLGSQNSKGGDFTFLQADGPSRTASKAPSGTTAMYRGRLDGRNDHFMGNYETNNGWSTDCWNHPDNISPAPADYLIPKDTWACVQWHFDADKNTMKFWLNNKELTQIQTVETGDGCVGTSQNGVWWGPQTFGNVRIGIEQYHNTSLARTMYIDDVALDNRFIPCATP